MSRRVHRTQRMQLPSDWPTAGPIDLAVHDLPHRSSTAEWWYLNAHLTAADGRAYSLFAAFFALAIDEGAKHRPDRIATTATRAGNGFRLDGKKSFVLHGHVADMSIVAAKTDGGITLFAVSKDAKGVTADPRRLVDSSLASHVILDGVEVDADAVIGEVDAGGEILDALLAATRTGAGAEMGGV